MSILDDLKKQRTELIKTGQARIKTLTDEINERQKEIDDIKALIGDAPIEDKKPSKGKANSKGKKEEPKLEVE